MRVYFIPTKAYVDWLVLQNRSKHQVRIEELEEMPTTTASHGIGGFGQWHVLDITNGCSNSNVPVPTPNTSFSMLPLDCHRKQAATFANSSEHFYHRQIPIGHSQFILQNQTHQQIAFVSPSSSTILAPIMEPYVNNGLINNQQLMRNASFYHPANNRKKFNFKFQMIF